MKKILLYFTFCVLLLSCAANTASVNKGLFSLSLTHFNDTHTSWEESFTELSYDNKFIKMPSGGYARLITASKSFEGNQNNIRVFAGDALLKGTALYESVGEDFDAEMLLMAGVDVMTIGNHEFDGGFDGFKKFLVALRPLENRIEILVANIIFDNPAISALIKPFTIKTINGRKVGIVGLSVPNATAPMDGVTFIDHIKAASDAVKKLQAENVNVIIFVTHIGFDDDIALAKAVPGIDVIIGGHTHTVQGDFSEYGINSAVKDYPFLVTDSDGNKTLIVTASSNTQNIGNLNVQFDSKGTPVNFGGASQLLLGFGGEESEDLKNKLKSAKFFKITDNDSSAEAVIKNYVSKIDFPAYSIVKFTAKSDLKTLRDIEYPLQAAIKQGHSSLGVHYASALLMEARAYGSKTHIAITNTGVLKKEIRAGDVTAGNFYEAVPNENNVVIFSIKGADLLSEIKKGLHRGLTVDPNNVPCLAGMKLTYTHDKDINNVSVSDVKILHKGKWVPFDENTVYTVTATAFVFEGGDKYSFKDKSISHSITDYKDRWAFETYINLMNPLGQLEDTIRVIVP